MSLEDDQKDFDERLHFLSSAQKIRNKCKLLRENPNHASLRWCWELLQNAVDYNKEVDVVFKISKDRLVYSHNGRPFRYEEIRMLIEPNSSKFGASVQDEPIIGKYGTGFLSTHILSLYVEITGIVQSKNGTLYDSHLVLDRTGLDDEEALMSSFQPAIDVLSESQVRTDKLAEGEFCTHITYHLDKPIDGIDGSGCAKLGLANLDSELPYVMYFVPKIRTVTILIERKNGNNTKLYYCKNTEKSVMGTTNGWLRIEKYDNDELDDSFWILGYKHGNAEVAVKIDRKDDQFNVLPLAEESPKLHCGFPFIGTERFPFPVKVHSYQFTPLEERNGISIEEVSKTNRTVIVEAKEAYILLIKHLTSEKVNANKLYHLINTNPVGHHIPATSKTWFETAVHNPINNALRELKIIASETRIELKNALFPVVANDDSKGSKSLLLHSIASYIVKEQIPKEEEVLAWQAVINFTIYKDQKLDFERLLQKISAYQTIAVLSATIGEENAQTLLKSLIINLITLEYRTLLDTVPILPNQNGEFRTAKQLKWDDEIPIEFKDILFLFDKSKDCRAYLLHKDYELDESLIPSEEKRTKTDIANEINAAMPVLYGGEPSGSFIQGLNMLMTWINENDLSDEDVSLLFGWYASNRHHLIVQSLGTDKERTQIFEIAQKRNQLPMLAKLANSNLDDETLSILANNPNKVKSLLAHLEDVIDDKKWADLETGNEGEELVYADLLKKYPEGTVVWASKEENEACYDFRIVNPKNEIVAYVDAKSSKLGIGNADSVPIFVRRSQWDFLSQKSPHIPYYLARVFNEGDALNIHYLNITLSHAS